MRIDQFNYQFPAALIAHHPLPKRDASRLLVLDRTTGALAHHQVRDLPTFLQPGDVVVINTSKVIPARLVGTRATGGKVEVLLLNPTQLPSTIPHPPSTAFWCLATRTNRLAVGTRLTFAEGIEGIVEERAGDRLAVRFNISGEMLPVLDRIGLPPLPPYIRRTTNNERQTTNDRERYQTIYADTPGSAAAPTAGLHLTEGLLEQLRANGIRIVPLALHVGSDTFSPVRTRQIAEHRMHGEVYTIPAETMATVARAKQEDRRVIAIGTTSVRALESSASLFSAPNLRTHAPTHLRTELFITPGYRFRIVDALLTNFHQPCSTLLMLVAAFAGTETIRQAYAKAIAACYRLFSYGDAMLIR